MNEVNKKTIQLTVGILIGFTLWVWWVIVLGSSGENAVHILDIGQGDSELITLASKDKNSAIKILVDGGRDKRVLHALDAALGKKNDKYLDIVILTHPDLDHFGGLVEVLRRYKVGLFISNGISVEGVAFQVLRDEIAKNKIQTLVLGEGDNIQFENASFFIMSPDRGLLHKKNSNEASIVFMLTQDDSRALFTGDIGFFAEEILLGKGYDLTADILKVAHHGSKNSSGENFVAAVKPLIAGVGVGQNSYGHPTPRVLRTLELAGATTFTTQNDGTIKIILDKSAPLFRRNGTSVEGVKKQGFLASARDIVTGNYKNQGILTVSLPDIKKEGEKEFLLVPYKKCSFNSPLKPTWHPIILSEIAWMGGVSGSTHEWVELENVTGKPINMSGWQVVNKNEKIHFIFPQQTVFEGRFFVIARSGVGEALGISPNAIFTGAMRNTDEGLRIFDNNCVLIDEVFASPHWPAGNNDSKQTMERGEDLTSKDSREYGGTPGRSNQ